MWLGNSVGIEVGYAGAAKHGKGPWPKEAREMTGSSARVSLVVAAALFFSSLLPVPAAAQTVSFARKDFPVGTNPITIAVGDFNGDGVPDLAVADEGSNNVAVLIGNGDGSFQPATFFPVGTNPVWVVVGDFNGDRVLDLAVANINSNNVSVLLGRGDGTFQPGQVFPVGSLPTSLTTGDFNGDGKLDLVVANWNSYDISVLRGNGDCTFQPPQNFAVGTAPLAVAVGSLNSDAIQDLVAANFSANTVSVLLGNGDGTFQAAQTFTVGTNPEFVAVGDFNRDGVPDLAVANFGSNTVTVLLALRVATPAFSPPGGTYDRPQSVAISDATPGATIYYTTDGSTPTTASTVYTGPIAVTRTTTIKAMATATGMVSSSVATAVYTLLAATPTFNPPGGTYLAPQYASISEASPGVTIYYTTDGSTPTTASTVYTSPILVVTTLGPTTIKAMAVAPGWSQSAVASATYTSGL